MTDYPIIFSAPMVLALLEGRKTMTRRLAWRRLKGGKHNPARMTESPWQKVQTGDRLWVRESGLLSTGRTKLFIFDASPGKWWTPQDGGRFGASYSLENFSREKLKNSHKVTPSIHMPRWASRLTLEVTAVKIEPLHAISYDDIVAEGAKDPFSQDTAAFPGPAARDAWEEKAQYAWESLWVRLHGQESWDDNPEVVAISFKVHNCNIDKLPT